jgi:hypothetical protein
MGREGIEPSTLGLRVPSGASLPFGRSRDFRLGDWDHTCYRMHGGWCGLRPCVLPNLLPTPKVRMAGKPCAGSVRVLILERLEGISVEVNRPS